ncbi:homoserine dehydrogenase [Arthrobacter sp. B10-11]|uniref:homoserine dehydrogenase n=1 Tax=Arthrobacter sp. B10-11 TaxID=3081160 RepID=UPI0029534AF0|nr:homoserine dehydrogenase [Arthrobacter sp. B10-11]MDV8149049.1 homoserine dehydrogenase [Arthrobacter sp. B10-11]
MTTYDLALIGFGGVNRSLAELIAARGEALRTELGFGLRVVAITDLRLGSLVDADGIDLSMALARGSDGETFARHGGSAEPDNESVIRNCTADIICEATFTNPDDGEPAVSHVRWALESGKSVCTTNKGPVALRGGELAALAEQQGVRFEFEGAVMSGTPVIRLAKQMFSGLKLNGFEGIMNGTSNYVLGRMEAGLDLGEAVREAQELGYAEANPAADLEGFDVQLKVLILANELLGGKLQLKDVRREGISAITPEDIRAAASAGRRWKLIGSARRTPDGGIAASVAPRALDVEHSLAGISGATNAVSFDTDLLGPVTVSGPGAGRIETAYALLSDIIAIHQAAAESRQAATVTGGLARV